MAKVSTVYRTHYDDDEMVTRQRGWGADNGVISTVQRGILTAPDTRQSRNGTNSLLNSSLPSH